MPAAGWIMAHGFSVHDFMQVAWMPSPPLIPDDGPLDLDHLARMTLGEAVLEREVLILFVAQARQLLDLIESDAAQATSAAHKLKGAARGIGAFAVAEAAEAVEMERLSRPGHGAFLHLSRAVNAACEAIAERLSQL